MPGVDAVERELSSIELDEAEQEPTQRRLAGTARSEDGERAARRDVQVDVVEHRRAARPSWSPDALEADVERTVGNVEWCVDLVHGERDLLEPLEPTA